MEKNQFQGMDRRTFLKTSSAISLGAAATFGTPGVSWRSLLKNILAKRLMSSATLYLRNIKRRY